jgi:hypothetical protein
MNAAHAHLILNHLPVLGIPFGLFTLLWGIFRRSDEVKRLALLVFLLAGLSAIPVFLTGDEADDIVEDVPGISSIAISEHEDAAKFSLASGLVLATLALAAFVLYGWKPAAGRALLWVCLVAALAVAGLFAWTANLGGHIRHPEITSTDER